MERVVSNTLSPSNDWPTFKDLTRPVRDVRKVRLLQDYIRKSRNIDHFKKLLSSFDDEEVEKYTRGQARNSHWHKARMHVITASNVYSMVNCINNKKIDKIFYRIEKRDMVGKFFPAILWGIRSEKVALRKYISEERHLHKDFDISSKGLVHSKKFPMLAMSPDGVQDCACHEKMLIEIKSPHSIRNSSVRKEGYRLRYLTHDLTLKKNCPEYWQLQLGMFCLEVKSAKLIVYTTKGLFTIIVARDLSLWPIFENKLPNFYYDEYLRHYFLQH